jgi:uncharacterized protein YxjI
MLATTAPPTNPGALDPAFQRKKFLLRQKVMRISEDYSVWDEQGREILYVHRPAHLLRGLLALFAGFACGFAVLILMVTAAGSLPEALKPVGVGISLLTAFPVGLLVAVKLSAKRHVGFYRTATRREQLLTVEQDQKFTFFVGTFTIKDATGRVLARLRKNYLSNLLRRRWTCVAPNGALLSTILEDSIAKALARRLMGPMLGFLRTNFVLYEGGGEIEIGRFDRKFTIRDHYVLDLTRDRTGALDPRIALAIGVMLDTGEKR